MLGVGNAGEPARWPVDRRCQLGVEHLLPAGQRSGAIIRKCWGGREHRLVRNLQAGKDHGAGHIDALDAAVYSCAVPRRGRLTGGDYEVRIGAHALDKDGPTSTVHLEPPSCADRPARRPRSTHARSHLKDTTMSSSTIRVGIIGAGGWARYGHIPALGTLDDFEIVAVASRTQESADRLAAQFNIPHAFGDHEDLIADPDIDLVVVLAPGPEHARLTRAAIEGGKDVYSEWPLTTSTAESEELLALAEAKGVRHVVGLQRRFAPSARYVRDLVNQGYVGKIRGVRMSVGVDAFPPTMSERHTWTIDAANFTHVLSIYGGHFGDLLFHTVGFPVQLTAVTETQFPTVTLQLDL